MHIYTYIAAAIDAFINFVAPVIYSNILLTIVISMNWKKSKLEIIRKKQNFAYQLCTIENIYSSTLPAKLFFAFYIGTQKITIARVVFTIIAAIDAKVNN